MLPFTRRCLFGFLVALPLAPLAGQSFSCGADPMRLRLFEQQPALRALHEQWEQQRQDRLTQGTTEAAKGAAAALYTIPVVVHIVHQNGAENISDAQVAAGIQMLNDAFANTGYYDQGNGAATPFRFCLARRRPDGSATSGINRLASPLTNMIMETQDLPLKNLSRWNPEHYLNVWLVRSVTSQSSGPGVAGYAYFPAAHGTDIDGIVMEAQFFGSNEAETGVLIHEAGHYLGLYHTFEGGCTNADCAKDGDRVCDTPPDQSTAWLPCGTPANTCSTDTQSGFSTDQPDMTINYMDYATLACYNAFSAGQSDRMEFFFNEARSSLLESQGCLDPCTAPVSAAFTASAGPVLPAGTSVNFANSSPNVQTWAWTVNSAPAGDQPVMNYIFTVPGQYIVQLVVQGADPNCFDKQSDTLLVICGVQVGFFFGPTYPEAGDTVLISSQAVGATGVSWTLNGTPAGNASVWSQVFSSPGAYTVCLTANDAYCQAIACKTIDVADVSGCAGSFFKTMAYENLGINPFLWGLDLLQLPDGDLLGIGGKLGDQYFVRYSSEGQLTDHWRFQGPEFTFITDAMTANDGDAVFTRGVVTTQGSVQKFSYVAKMNCTTRQPAWYKNLSHPTRNVHTWHLTENPVTQLISVFGRVANPGLPQSPTDEVVLLAFSPATGDILAQKNYRIGTVPFVRASAWVNNDLYAVGGNYNTNTPMLTKFDAFGNALWSRGYSFSASGVFNGQLRDLADIRYDASDASLVAVGAYNLHLYFLKTDLNGQPITARVFYSGFAIPEASHVDKANVDVLPDGYLISYGQETGGAQTRLVLLKLDKNGNLLWRKSRAELHLNGPEVVVQSNHAFTFSGLDAANNKFFLLKTPLEPPTANDCVNESFTLDVAIPQWTVSNIVPVEMPVVPVAAQSVQTISEVLPQPLATVCAVNTCPEICTNNLDDDGDGLTDCEDVVDCPCANPDCAIPVPPVTPKVVGKEEWRSAQTNIFDWSLPIVANLNPQQDNIPEIIVTTYSPPTVVSPRDILIYKGDGSNSANPARILFSGINGNFPQEATAVGDLDGNGIPELIAVFRNSHLRVYSGYDPTSNPPMTLTMENNQLLSQNIWPGLADFDGDGRPEIYVGRQVYWINHAAPGLNKLVSITPVPVPAPHLQSFAADLLSVADCNGDPDCEGLELVTGNTIFSVDLADTPIDGDPRAIIPRRTVDAVPGGSVQPDGPVAVADIDLDGTLDIITRVRVATNPPTGYAYAWNAKKFIWKFDFPALGYYGSEYHVSVANVFDDTKMGAANDLPEIFYGSAMRLYSLNLNAAVANPANPYWWSVPIFDGSGFSNPVSTFDFDGDGRPELVARTQDSLRVIYGGNAPFPAGVRPDRTWFALAGNSGTNMEYPTIADVDNDGAAEIVFAASANTLGGGGGSVNAASLRVIGADLSKSLPWKPTRRLWNQYSYAPYMVNDDLTIPKIPQNSTAEIPPGSKHRPLNVVLGQPVPATNNGYKYVPDAALDVVQTRCAGGQVEVRLRVCNIGLDTLPAGTPIRFYVGGDPTTTAVPRLAAAPALTSAVLPDSCTEILVMLPKVPFPTIFAVVNDNGNHSTPFDMPADFPLTNISECNYANNFASFDLPPALPPPALGPDVEVCENGVWTFLAGAGFQQYRWSNLSADSSITVYEPGTYWVEATDHCGIVYRDTVVVALSPAGVVNLGGDRKICADSLLLLQATPGFSEYTWFPAEGLSCSDCPNPTAQPPQSRTYTVQAKSLLGCFSFDTVFIEVNQPVQTAEQRVICAGDSAFIFGNYETAAGVYAQTFSAVNGCDSVHQIALSVLPVFQTSEQRAICAGDSASIFGNYETAAGVYAQTFSAANGCDSVHQIALAVLPVFQTSEYRAICAGDSAFIFGNYETAAGMYTQTFSAVNGCDSVHQIALAVLPVYQTSEQHAICAGDSALIFGNYETSAGMYSQTFSAVNGCDSVHQIALSVLPVFQTSEQRAICAGDSVLIFGNYETAAGTYAQTFSAVNGCDSVHQIALSVLPMLQTSEYRAICAGDSALIFGNYETTAGMYAQTFSAVNGCDSVHQIALAVLSVFQTSEQRAICAGDSALIFGNYEAAAGTYTQTFSAANGCDSVHQIALAVLPVFQTTEQRAICAGDSALIFGNYEAAAGTYTQTFSAANGCDSVHQIALSVLPVFQTTEQRAICAGDSALIFGNYETAAGMYAQTFSAVNGCDSVHQIALSVLPVLQTNENLVVCVGDSVLVFGQYVSSSGTFTRTYQAVGGCDSVVIIAVQALPVFQTSESRQICAGDSSLIFGQHVTTAGAYTRTFPAQNGCDSTHTVSLMVLPALYTNESQILCAGDSVLVFGQYISVAGTYTQTFPAAGGCDSVVTVNVQTVPEPQADLLWLDPTCFGQADGRLSIESAPAGAVFSLDGAPFGTAPSYTGLAAGPHILRVRSPEGCLWETTAELTVPPLVSVSLPGDTLIEQGQSLQIQAETSGGVVQYAWSPATGLDCAACPAVVAAPAESTLYTLTVTNASGCTATDQMLIEVQQKPQNEVYLPNAMMPDRAGANRFFTVYAGANVAEVLRLEVYDRWGGLVFRREHFAPNVEALGWDGTWRGQPVAPGVYAYVVEVAYADGTTGRVSGGVTVLR